MFDWISDFIERSGYLGIALLMLAENVFPPIPSELIMPLAGFAAARGEIRIVPVILAGTSGSVLGALFWYAVGRWVGEERLKRYAARHGRWLTLTPDDVEQAQGYFSRHRGKALFFGRLLPAVRTLISIPAGIVRMPLLRFLLYSSLGTALWTALLAGAGYLLEAQYGKVAAWLNPVTNTILGAAVLAYLYRVATYKPKGAVDE